MHPLVVIEEERGPEISRRLFVRGLFRNENARELFPALVGSVRRGTADPARANIAPVLITLLQMTAIISDTTHRIR
jgi:hypothetical protein